MRGIHYLLGGLIAVLTGASHASGKDYCFNFAASASAPAINARLVCRIRVTVTVVDGKCYADAPKDIYVSRNPDFHPILLLFYIKDFEGDSTVTFDDQKGVQITGKGSANSPWENHFGEPKFQDRRVYLVVDKHSQSGVESFPYAIKVKKNGADCDSTDPTIHNTN